MGPTSLSGHLFFRTDIYLGQGGTQSKKLRERERRERRELKNLANAALFAVPKKEIELSLEK